MSTASLTQVNNNSEINVCMCTHVWLGVYNGGVERIESFARALSKKGVNVYIIDRVASKSLSALINDKDTYREVKNGKMLIHLYPRHMIFLFPGILKFFQEALNQIFRITGKTIKSEVFYSQILDLYLMLKLFFVCKKENITVIQSEYPYSLFSAFVIGKLLNIPIVYDAHNVESERLKSLNSGKLQTALTRKIEIKSCNLCNAVFTVSSDDKRILQAMGISGKKMTIIPNSIELDKCTF
ncbi:MAG: glycosyltransferase family 4 protein [Candidatus Bathyarchaeia archaeon]